MHELGEAARMWVYLEAFKTFFGLLLFPIFLYFFYKIFSGVFERLNEK